MPTYLGEPMSNNHKYNPRDDAEFFVDTKRLLKESQDLRAKSEFDNKFYKIDRQLHEDLLKYFRTNGLERSEDIYYEVSSKTHKLYGLEELKQMYKLARNKGIDNGSLKLIEKAIKRRRIPFHW